MTRALMQNDVKCPLRELRKVQKSGLVSQLVEIEAYRLNNTKCLEWYQGSTYLTGDYKTPNLTAGAALPCQQRYDLQHTLERKQQTHQARLDSVLAVSYTWTASKYEESRDVDFQVFERGRADSEKSKVRGSILHRVLRYVCDRKLPGFWIDGECIEQEDSPKQQIAMRSMDLVYRFGDRSVAFLTTPVRTANEVKLLVKLMGDRWIRQNGPIDRIKLQKYVRVEDAQAMISLLEHILSDLWWTRAWTYQEEYCASGRMHLLIPSYVYAVERQVRTFSDVPGELTIHAIEFRQQVTRFCLAHQRKIGDRWQEGSIRCRRLLEVANQHKTVEAYTKATNPNYQVKALSWHIIDDLAKRQISKAWDLLPIIANCCGYSVRLDADQLRRAGYSLSAAIFALVLVNGEIIYNDLDSTWTSDVSLPQVWNQVAFRDFGTVVDVKELTFLKRCRLINVAITCDGILTDGCLWVLHDRVSIPKTNAKLEVKIQLRDAILSPYETSQLRLLCCSLASKHSRLAASIRRFLQQVEAKEDNEGRLKFMIVMAQNLVRSIQSGKTLAVGSSVGQGSGHGIFVAEKTSKFCFIAWQGRKKVAAINADRYLEKIVSLEVDLLEPKGPLKRLKIRKWINGLCFFDTTEQSRLLLPWPAAFEKL